MWLSSKIIISVSEMCGGQQWEVILGNVSSNVVSKQKLINQTSERARVRVAVEIQVECCLWVTQLQS